MAFQKRLHDSEILLDLAASDLQGLVQHAVDELVRCGKLSDRQRQRLEEILATHQGTVLAQAYACKEAILTLFRQSQSKADARARRNAILKRFGNVPELDKVLNVIRGDGFEQMIVYLDYENLDKTNNNAVIEDDQLVVPEPLL